MRYMGFVKMDPKLTDPPQALMDAMDVHIQECLERGVFLDGGGLYATSFRGEVKVRDGEVTTFDGPFTEGRETVGGYSVLEFRDHDEAMAEAQYMVDLHLKHWPGWEGSVEVRRIAGPDEVGNL